METVERLIGLITACVCVTCFAITGCSLDGKPGTYHSWSVTVIGGETTWVTRTEPRQAFDGQRFVEGAWRFTDEEGAEVTVPVSKAIIVRQTLSE